MTNKLGSNQYRGDPYPWDKIFGIAIETPKTLKKGKDYTCQPHSFATLLRIKARKRGVRVSVRINGESLTYLIRSN